MDVLKLVLVGCQLLLVVSMQDMLSSMRTEIWKSSASAACAHPLTPPQHSSANEPGRRM